MLELHGLDSKSARWLSILAGPIISLVAFLLAEWLDPLRFGNQHPMAAIPAFFFSMVVLLISQAIITGLELQRTSVYSDRIYDAIKGYLHITPVGSPEEALRYIESRLPALREVKNTSFNLATETERAREKFYNTNVYIRMSQQIALYCSRDLLWKDIGDGFAIERFRPIQNECERLSHGRSSCYHFKLIAHNEPQINFIILEYTDGATEVLFNWDFRGIGQDPIVLISRDKHMLDMFSIQFAMLWDRGSEYHDNHATISTSVK